MRIQLLLTGSELMSGDTVDSNSALIAQRMAEAGWRVQRKVTVGDSLEQLIDEIAALSADSDLLLVNGGLGPTVDDRTAQALAQVAEVPLAEHPEALAHLQQWCERRGMRLNAANRKQALLPAGAAVVPNGRGSAVGFSLEHNDCLIICTPGVPPELRLMLDEQIMPLLRGRFPAEQNGRKRLFIFGLGESSLQQRITEAFPDWPEQIELGFRAGMPVLELKLTGVPGCPPELLAQWHEKVRALLGDYVLSHEHLGAALIEALEWRGAKVTTAESCTGGAIAAAITEAPGASTVFDAGFVTYSNAMKQAVLGVRAADLETDGAVSEAVVKAMAEGALQRTGADFAVATSGIAGPTGGSAGKPVGTLWLAWGTPALIKTERLQLPAERHLFQQLACAIALDLLRRAALAINAEPAYLKRWRAQ